MTTRFREKMRETILLFLACSARLRVLKRFWQGEMVASVVFQASGYMRVDDSKDGRVGDRQVVWSSALEGPYETRERGSDST